MNKDDIIDKHNTDVGCKHDVFYDHPSRKWVCRLCGKVFSAKEVRMLQLNEIDKSDSSHDNEVEQ